MTVLDIGNNVAVNTQIVAQTLAASSADATAVDMKNVTWAIVHINAGTKAGTASAYTFKVEHSTDNAAFTTCDKVGSAAGAEDATIVVTATPGATDERTYLVAIDARRVNRYVRVACDIDTGSDDFPVACSIITMPDYTGQTDTPEFSV